MKFSRLNPRLATLAVPIVALVVAGCGGGGGDTTEATQAQKPTPVSLSAVQDRDLFDVSNTTVGSAADVVGATDFSVASSSSG